MESLFQQFRTSCFFSSWWNFWLQGFLTHFCSFSLFFPQFRFHKPVIHSASFTPSCKQLIEIWNPTPVLPPSLQQDALQIQSPLYWPLLVSAKQFGTEWQSRQKSSVLMTVLPFKHVWWTWSKRTTFSPRCLLWKTSVITLVRVSGPTKPVRWLRSRPLLGHWRTEISLPAFLPLVETPCKFHKFFQAFLFTVACSRKRRGVRHELFYKVSNCRLFRFRCPMNTFSIICMPNATGKTRCAAKVIFDPLKQDPTLRDMLFMGGSLKGALSQADAFPRKSILIFSEEGHDQMAKLLSSTENLGVDASAVTKLWSGVCCTNNLKRRTEFYDVRMGILLCTQPTTFFMVSSNYYKLIPRRRGVLLMLSSFPRTGET